ncbi:transketolase [Propionivibrio sp.]|uniref:transketolase n=1 Tax=Propionivibrio sp. TaxID=2212460 RepID=UPI00272E8457|nr:transketolase [Propionivibrio sp.]
MSLSKARKDYLEGLCQRLRQDLIKLLYSIQTGHPGGSLSSTEIMTTLYFEKLRVDPKNPKDPNRDRFILGKGHAAPMLYQILSERGFFPQDDLATLRQLDSHLQGHPCAKKTCGVELSTGPLGLGLPAGLGMAMAARLDNKDFRTYVLMGDGELQEGIVWEAAMSAAKFGADNLLVIVDNNGVQLDGTVAEIMPMGDIAAKWQAFGWNVISIDGHCVEAVSDAIDLAATVKGKPTVIVAKTVKGKGVSFMEGNSAWHGKPISKDEYVNAMKELGVNV